MERDFLGLNSMEPSLAASVKREISYEENQLPFMKKFSSFPHFAPFRAGAGQDDGMNKMDFSLSLSNSNIKPNSVGSGQNIVDAITRQQFEGVPKAISPPTDQIVGFTEPRNNSKSSAPPPQMTIFYGGVVSIYEGISLEKAQAIMLMAANGSFLGSNKNPPSPQVQSPVTKVPSNVATGKDEQAAAKTTEISSATPPTKPQNQRVAPSRGPVAMSTITPSAVPQFRKASLARFLEKRKERVMSSGPYTCEKKQKAGVIPANDNVSFALASAAARRS